MTGPPASAPRDPDSYERITPFIESAIVELAMLTVKMVTTPFAVLFNTRDFRDQVRAFRYDELNARYSATVARPLSFYILWMAVHFLLASSYWRYVSREKISVITSQVPAQLQKFAAFLKSQAWSDITGQAEALMIIAFAVTAIIGVKSALVTLLGRAGGCRIRFETVLFASAYSMGTLLFFQYAFILSHYSIDALLGSTQQQPGGYYIFAYGSLLICIVLTYRVNRMIQTVDGTGETPTFIAWFIGTLIWLYLIVLMSGVVLGTELTFGAFWKTFYNALTPAAWNVVI